MNADLLKAASEVITDQGILVNMVSRRVKQLMQGHRPLLEHAPGLKAADVALMEIGRKKLTYELNPDPKTQTNAAKLVEFPADAGKKQVA